MIIEIAKTEINRFAGSDFIKMNSAERRRLFSRILRSRGDRNSHNFANTLERGSAGVIDQVRIVDDTV